MRLSAGVWDSRKLICHRIIGFPNVFWVQCEGTENNLKKLLHMKTSLIDFALLVAERLRRTALFADR